MTSEAFPTATNILTTLPREIRNQIWTNVLSTTTGYVKIGPKRYFRSETLYVFEVSKTSPPDQALKWNFHEPINLSLIRTCVQIYEETQGMFWRFNTLVLHPMPRGFIKQHSDTLEEEMKNVRHVRFEIDFESTAQWKTEQTFAMLGTWAIGDNLKTLEVCLKQGLQNFLDVVDSKAGGTDDGKRMCFQEYIWILRKASRWLDGLDRRISIITGWIGESFPVEDMRFGSRRQSSRNVVLNTLVEIHDAFGGELWQDGKLCYKDHVQVAQAFHLDNEA